MSLHFSGIKSSGKVVYFSATFPYLLLITLMIYALLQDGAIDGVKKLFIVKEDEWDKLLDFNVWRQAAGQVPYYVSKICKNHPIIQAYKQVLC